VSGKERLLRIAGASFGYRGRAVLTRVDLEIPEGCLVSVLGPNGSGKTTLLRGATGLLPPLAGTVQCNKRALGYVPQRERLDPVFPLSVIEVVQMGAYSRLRGLRRLSRGDRVKAERCLEQVDLLERRGERFASLSGGQRQRALLARALLMEPRLLVLDEPTSGVDEHSQRLISELLHERVGAGLSVLLITHQYEMTRGTDLLLRVADGRVTPEEPNGKGEQGWS